MEIAKAEAELKKNESAGEPVPTDFVVRYASVSHEALVSLATDSDGMKTLLGPLPEGFEMPKPQAGPSDKTSVTDPDVSAKPATITDSGAPPLADQAGEPAASEEPQPKVEEMDIDTAHLPIPTVEHAEQKDETGDVDMDDAGQSRNGLPTSEPDSTVMNGTPGEAAHHLLPPGFEQPPTGLSTPTQMEMEDDDDETEIEEIDYATIETVRQYMKTPPIDELPHYQCRPWFRDRQFMKSLDPSPDVHAFVASLMRDSAIVTMAAQEEARQEYSEDYEMYLRFTLSEDPIAVKSRDKFSTGNPNGDFTAPHPASHEGKPEGRRTGRFATERDLERALQESLQAENERREREERAQKEKYRSEKEAEIPDMYWSIEEREKDLFIDHSGFLPPERLVATWQVLPPVANFTEEEAEQFEKAYLEFPKQWGKIAENIPTRDFHSCIQYYYIKKKDLNLKEKLKKQPRRRKKGGRGKQRSSALVTEVLGIGDENTEENHETGENGERRRPRRAAAPTFGPNHHEATPAADSDGTATPGRRHAGAKNDSGTEKIDRRRRRGREKEPKQAKPAQTLAPTPAVAAKANRSRSNSRAQGPEFLSPQTPADLGR
ncbi:putative myb-like dna-binding protein [Phaeoacremonium minimum UCRPA7]|uniref:Putative myb-like dna-binding protein n=1 Tax=Phaeoacremonium minimum (strain UCR-PA7) TaxID=1286976 RepID=R8BCN8_PHAM7|nr:putative myb-like dna-binding protein [Phaeoacremonium minimum UCRPA7]EON97068.1 putative myb-like dna-binding protein [Phaeoacremonium minimum UCRPA7]